MALIKEPLDVDFFVESKPLSDTERKTISEFIKNYKKKHAFKKKRNVVAKKKRQLSVV